MSAAMSAVIAAVMCDEVPDIDEGVRRWFYGGTPAAGDSAPPDKPRADGSGAEDRRPAEPCPPRPQRPWPGGRIPGSPS